MIYSYSEPHIPFRVAIAVTLLLDMGALRLDKSINSLDFVLLTLESAMKRVEDAAQLKGLF